METESEPEADPGLCVVVPDRLADPVRLIDYGYLAKREVLDKNSAYTLASELGIHLSEHGGTGQGLIGVMAGAGLRLGGNDGSFKDKSKHHRQYAGDRPHNHSAAKFGNEPCSQ